uniref:T3.4 protein n=1 Tax=Malus x robusta TaxID=1184610 RepID=I7IG79_9ROSA|nr:T3.4 [Malus x robusta]
MGDLLRSSRVSSQKQNHEGVVGAQSGQYRATIESSTGCGGGPGKRSGIEKQKALEKAAKLQEKTDMFYATQNRMLPTAYRLFTEVISKGSQAGLQRFYSNLWIWGRWFYQVFILTSNRSSITGAYPYRATRMGVEVKRMRDTNSKVIQ